MELNAKNVHDTVVACLYNTGEDPSQGKEVRAVKLWVKFDPARLATQRANILAMLSQMPHLFRDTHIAQGCSFLLACEREDGTLWGQHNDVDALVALGLAIDAVEFRVNREHWNQLPMGVPPFVVKLPVEHIDTTVTLALTDPA